MKKLYITLCTLSALVAGITLQAMERTTKAVDALTKPVEAPEQTPEQKNAEMNKRTQEQNANRSKQQADAKNKERFGTPDTTSTVDLKINETTDTNVNLTSGDNSTTSTPSQGIALTEVTPDAQPTEQNVNEPLSNNEPSDVFNKAEQPEDVSGRTESTESLRTVDLNDEGVPAEVVDEAKKVTDKSSFRKFIETLSKLFFRENSDNPEVQDAIRASIADAESQQWWSPWDGSKFQTWYDNTMESFRKVKASLPTVSLFSSESEAMRQKVSNTFKKDDFSSDLDAETEVNWKPF